MSGRRFCSRQPVRCWPGRIWNSPRPSLGRGRSPKCGGVTWSREQEKDAYGIRWLARRLNRAGSCQGWWHGHLRFGQQASPSPFAASSDSGPIRKHFRFEQAPHPPRACFDRTRDRRLTHPGASQVNAASKTREPFSRQSRASLRPEHEPGPLALAPGPVPLFVTSRYGSPASRRQWPKAWALCRPVHMVRPGVFHLRGHPPSVLYQIARNRLAAWWPRMQGPATAAARAGSCAL